MPPGFASAQQARQAVTTGQVPFTNLFIPLPPSIKLARGIEYANVSGRALHLDLYQPKHIE